MDENTETQDDLQRQIDELIQERHELMRKYKNMEAWNKWMIQEIGRVHEIARKLASDLVAIREVCRLEGMAVTIGNKSLEQYNSNYKR